MLLEVGDGTRLWVQDHGTGRPVVLVAGLGMSHDAWDPVVTAVAGAGYRTICIDMRGTGSSERPLGPYPMDLLVSDVASVLEALDVSEASVVGWSLGGQIALALAAHGSSRVRQIVMLCSNGVRAGRTEEFPFGRDGSKLLPMLQGGELGDRPAMRRQSIVSGFAVPPSDDLAAWLTSVSLRMPSWSAIAYYETYLTTDLVAALSDVNIPVRQIMGSVDPVTPVEGAEWVQERVADGELTVLEGCGHFPMYEQREAFEAALLGYLGELPQT